MKLNKFIDHTLLKADATAAQIEQLCQEAREYDFFAVCVNPCWVAKAKEWLKGCDVKVCSVIGFPLGTNTTEIKAAETERAIADGADEIDMVIPLGALKAGDVDYVKEDIATVVNVAAGRPVKVILETCLLTQEQIIQACRLAVEAGAAFVKTSTGFSTDGATLDNVRLMKQEVGKKCEVKASGGIKDRETALAMIEAGATRLGTSSGKAIVHPH